MVAARSGAGTAQGVGDFAVGGKVGRRGPPARKARGSESSRLRSKRADERAARPSQKNKPGPANGTGFAENPSGDRPLPATATDHVATHGGRAEREQGVGGWLGNNFQIVEAHVLPHPLIDREKLHTIDI